MIAELTSAAWRTPNSRLWQALAATYRTAHDVSVKLGYYDLSSVALDRMNWAAQRASDPQLVTVRPYMRALVCFREGEYTIGQRLIRSGHGLLGQVAAERATTAAIGQLHLGATVIAARAGDTTALEVHLAEAVRCAKETKTIRLPPSLATSRRAHFLIDRARSEMETGRTEAAQCLFLMRSCHGGGGDPGFVAQACQP